MASLKLQRARELRQQATPAEQRLWELLRNRRMLGLKFRRQYLVAGLIVDFSCAELRLVLEVDGEIHTTPEQLDYDAARTRHLEARGLHGLRIANAEVSAASVRRLLGEPSLGSPSPRRVEGVRG